MKNIHVLPTEKPSIICKLDNVLVLSKIGTLTNDTKSLIRQNIYITSDEEIKEGDYWLNLDRNDINNGELFDIANMAPSCKKIILTTDQDLIKDGVQAIDDEFLEWFVKNPSCEEVDVANSLVRISSFDWRTDYKIIIPKEEPKQETLEEFINSQPYYGSCTTEYLEGIEIGAKWQQEQDKNKYSEDEVEYMFNTLKENSIDGVVTITNIDLFINSWRKQFKNK